MLYRSRKGKRWASEILRDFGNLECPPDVVPAPSLFREARRALGWKQEEAWRPLGFSRRSTNIQFIESGKKIPSRCTLLLLVHHLKALDRRQRKLSIAAAYQPPLEEKNG